MIRSALLSLLIVAPVFGQPTTQPATRPHTTRPAFSIGGMHIGDKVTEEWAYTHRIMEDGHALESSKIDDKDLDVMYHFENSKLDWVFLAFDPALFQRIVETFSEKYGKPELSNEEVKNGLGVRYQNIMAKWQTSDGELVLFRFGDTTTKGWGVIKTPAWEQHVEKSAEERKNALRDKL